MIFENTKWKYFLRAHLEGPISLKRLAKFPSSRTDFSGTKRAGRNTALEITMQSIRPTGKHIAR